MANSDAVWGIDIGQCSLKALRCTMDEDGETIIADAYDYIEYPKLLSQPDAEPEQLIREALEQFLSRNELKGDRVAISVSGQAGLSRFFKPPPVDVKTLPDIVKYEARQQIPFALEDVIWDYQQIGGKTIDGITMDAEVGLFAMKRDAVYKSLKPFLDADIEVDIVQLSPISIYNVVLHDLLTDLPAPDQIDPAHPPESSVVVLMGTDTTDLVITDGYKLWLRNIPIGGNHFTKQLARELKLTYAKAEHLKRNARKAEDPKTVFQAMRPVFSDLVTELQRSLSYFQGIERKAQIGQVMMFGNASNLPGLRQYLNKNLGVEITKFTEFPGMRGDPVLSSKKFQENVLSYSVCYGLCLQGLGKSRMKTNLLPREFITERLIRAKKPWVLASVGALLLAFSFHYFFTYQAWWKVHNENQTADVTWERAKDQAQQVKRLINGYETTDQEQMQKLAEVHAMEESVTGVTDGRRLWSEMLSSLYQTLPRDDRITPGEPVNPAEVPYVDRREIYIEYIETEYFPNLSTWFSAAMAAKYETDQRYIEQGVSPDPADPADPAATATDPSADVGLSPTGTGTAGAATTTGPTGPGFVIEIKGHHYFNGPENLLSGYAGGNFVRDTLIRNIVDSKFRVRLPMPPGAERAALGWSMRELGLSFPVLVVDEQIQKNYRMPNVNHPSYTPSSGAGGPAGPGAGGPGGAGSGAPGGAPPGSGRGGAGGAGGTSGGTDAGDGSEEPLYYAAPRYDFILQIAWQPVTLTERLKAREERQRIREAQAASAPAGDPGTPAGPPAGPGLPTGPGQPAAPGTPDPAAGDPAVDPAAGDPAVDPAAGDSAVDPAAGDPAVGPAAGDPAVDPAAGAPGSDPDNNGTGDATGEQP